MRLCALLLMSALIALAQDSPRALEGSVVNSITGAGIEGAKITLMGKGTGFKESVTDVAGNFQISGLAPGDYEVRFQKTGFFIPPPVYPDLIPRTLLHVDAARDPPRLRLELVPPAILRGRVFDADGKPAAKVQVTLGPRYETKTTTGDDGAFVIENVQPGQVSLAVLASHVRISPATTDPAIAEPISVRAGEDQGGYEIRLQTANLYRVRGVVLDAAGRQADTIVSLSPDLAVAGGPLFAITPAAGAAVFSLSEPRAGVQPVREPDVASGRDGTFEFPFVREGDWLLRAEAENTDRVAALISVRKDIDDVRIQVQASVGIVGTVDLSDGSPAPAKTSVNVMLTSRDDTYRGSGNTDKTGSVRVGVSPGLYRITAIALSPGYYVASVMIGDVDAMRQPALLSDSSPPFRIVLKPGGRLSGNVEKGEGSKLLLVPQTLSPGDIARAYPCGAGGNFELTGIPPGDYYAIAVTQFDPPFKGGIAGPRAIMRDATSVRVEEGALTSIQLKPPITLP